MERKYEIKFQTSFPIPPKALTYLQLAEKNNRFSFFNAGMATDLAEKGLGFIAIVSCETEIVGCFSISFRVLQKKRHMTLTLLGGENIKLWRDELVQFLHETAKKYRCVDFSIMGPRAWGRLFPEIEEVSCIFMKRLI